MPGSASLGFINEGTVLRPFQSAAVTFYMARPDKRAIFAHATSAGKTLSAIGCAGALGAKRILIVCPAVARGTWKQQFNKWTSASAHPIQHGRSRTGLSKRVSAARDAAYAAEIQVVSYNLLKQVSTDARDLIIFDEVHALRASLSQQSKIARAYLLAYPGLPALGLTATPIPTEVKQIYNPLDTFWPGQWGKRKPGLDGSWDFEGRYCERVENEHGVSYRGSKSPSALADLSTRLTPYIHRVTDKEVAAFLPPLHASPLWLDERQASTSVATDWLGLELERGTTHMAIVAFNRETAHELAETLNSPFLVTGEQTPEQRANVIAACAAAPFGVLVATCESIREAISLSFCQAALIFQWRSSPAQAIQLMGRFRRQDAKDLTTPVRIEYVVMPGEERRAELLSSRIADIQQLMAADSNSEVLQEVFKPRELSEEQTRNLMLKMFENFSPDWADWSDDDED